MTSTAQGHLVRNDQAKTREAPSPQSSHPGSISTRTWLWLFAWSLICTTLLSVMGILPKHIDASAMTASVESYLFFFLPHTGASILGVGTPGGAPTHYPTAPEWVVSFYRDCNLVAFAMVLMAASTSAALTVLQQTRSGGDGSRYQSLIVRLSWLRITVTLPVLGPVWDLPITQLLIALTYGAQGASVRGWLTPVIAKGPIESFRIIPIAMAVRYLFQLPAINAIGHQTMENRQQAIDRGEKALSARIETWAKEESGRGIAAGLSPREDENVEQAVETIEKRLYAELQRGRAAVDESSGMSSARIYLKELAAHTMGVAGMCSGRLIALIGAFGCAGWFKTAYVNMSAIYRKETGTVSSSAAAAHEAIHGARPRSGTEQEAAAAQETIRATQDRYVSPDRAAPPARPSSPTSLAHPAVEMASWLGGQSYVVALLMELMTEVLPSPTLRGLMGGLVVLWEVVGFILGSMVFLQHRQSSLSESAMARAVVRAAVARVQAEKQAHAARRNYLRYLFHEARQPAHSIRLGLEALHESVTAGTEGTPVLAAHHEHEDEPRALDEHSQQEDEEQEEQQPLRSVLTKEDRALLDSMRAAAESQANIFNSVLSLSAMENQALKLDVQPCDVRALAESTLDRFRAWARSQGVTLTLTIAPGTPQIADLDRHWIGQVLSNFVSNALKVSGEGSQVKVDLSGQEGPRGRDGLMRPSLKVAVVDQGPGIPLAEQSKVFMPYVQIRTRGKRVEGTGLGLVIAAHVVKEHKGKIGFVSADGQGSTFWFTVPTHCGHLGEKHVDLRGQVQTRTGSGTASSPPSPSMETTTTGSLSSPSRSTTASVVDTPVTTRVLLQQPNTESIRRRLAGTPTPSTSMSISQEEPEVTTASSGQSTAETAGTGLESRASTGPAVVCIPSIGPHSGPRATANLLMVDDESMSRKLMGRLCTSRLKQSLGWTNVQVHEAADGLDALTIVKKLQQAAGGTGQGPNIILMDASMPRLDGYQATRALREELGYRGPIIGVTGNALQEDQQHFMDCGANAVLTKPVEPKALTDTLAQFL